MKNYELKLYLKSKANIERMAKAANEMDRQHDLPEHLVPELRELISVLESKVERWLPF